MNSTKVSLHDKLPLTCSRSGSCCHGNKVLLNPWELYRIASEKKCTSAEFRDLHTDSGGIQLRFNGTSQWNGKSACNQYIEGKGCSVHFSRPLACRLFPLGRQIQNNTIQYIHEGNEFPCLKDCPEVTQLPYLSVSEYLEGQGTESFEQAHDSYLELMQDLADISFEFLLDTGLAKSGDTKTVALWQTMGNESAEQLSKRIGQDWMDNLMIPALLEDFNDPFSFIQQHAVLIEQKIQENFGSASSNNDFHQASVQIMGLALQLARAIGADPKVLAEQWCDVAKNNGAFDN